MYPFFTSDYSANLRLRYPKYGPYAVLGDPFSAESADLQNVGFGNLTSSMATPSHGSGSPLAVHVPVIVGACPKEQMRWAETDRSIALMADEHIGRNNPDTERIGNTVDAALLTHKEDSPIPIVESAPWPNQAIVTLWNRLEHFAKQLVVANLVSHLRALLGSGCMPLAAVARCGGTLILASAAAYSQSFPGSIYVPLLAKDNIQTTLAIAMAPGDGVAFVASSTGWAVNMVGYICDTSTATRCTGTFEVMRVTAVAPNAITVTRGYGGTSAIGHAAGRAFLNAPTAVYNTSVTAETLAIETALGANLANVFLHNPSATWTNTTDVGAYSGQIGAFTAKQIYQSGQEQFNLLANDGVQGVSTIPFGSTQWEGAGVFGGVQNASTVTNAVAGRFYGLAIGPGLNDANRVKIWGINTLIKDGSLATNFSNILLLNEWDFNVNNASTKVIAHSIGGASSAQPVSALGYTVNTLGGAGTTIKWDYGFGSLDGTTDTFASIGTRDLLSTSTTSASQKILFFSRAASVVRSATINLDSTGILYLAPQLAAGGVSLQDGLANNIIAVASGHATIGGPLVVAQYAFAGLPAAASHSGGVVICVACTASSSPCTAGGANVMARSTGAQWNCGSF